MKIALPIWEERLSPVFDTALQLLCVELQEGKEVSRSEWAVPAGAAARADHLQRLGVDVLICGAISRPLAEMIVSSGVELVPFISGAAEDVVAAYKNGNVRNAAFCMPGCRSAGGRRGRGCGGPRRGWRGGCE